MIRDDIKIRLIDREDCEQVARLHTTNIQIGVLSILGISFVKLIYQSMIGSNNAFCIVAEDNNKIVGFVSGTTSLNKFYKEFIKNNFIKAPIVLLPKIINPKIMRKIFNILLYPNRVHGLPEAEFMSIVIDERYRVKGLARILINELIKDFKKRGINKFKSVVSSSLVSVYKFYEIMGATFHSDIAVYKGEKWKAHIWEI